MIPVAAMTDDPGCVTALQTACDRFGFTRADTIEAIHSPYYLQFYDNRIVLRSTDGQHGDIELDFTAGSAAHRLKFGGGKKQPLARAVGLHRWKSLSIVDATAGFGTDAAVLASLGLDSGATVTLIERCPPLACLLEHATIQATRDPATQRWAGQLRVQFADSIRWMTEHHCDVVYLDPMYPHTGKSAQVKKGMQALRVLAGPDVDSALLLQSALGCASKRVVVKRPKGAPPLTAPPETAPPVAAPLKHRNGIDDNDEQENGRVMPDTSITSPNTRYDIYSTSLIRKT